MTVVNEAEEFVYSLCRQSFLSLWSYANPLGDSARELCDILVVCEPDIIIFSVKDIKFKETGDVAVDWERWRKKAVDASAKQIYGAERHLKTASNIIRSDGSLGLPLSPEVSWRYHRIAVALGAERKVPFDSRDFGKGYVHVLDENSFHAIATELNTITDFVHYLTAKEQLHASEVETIMEGGEEDLLALYLHQGREFPSGPDTLILSAGLWSYLSNRADFRRRQQADRESYAWDKLIEEMSGSTPSDALGVGTYLTETELAVRGMARETRFARRMLGKSLIEFLKLAKAGRIHSRIMPSPISDVTFLFLHVAHGESAKEREVELGNRCYIARGTVPLRPTVIGISFEEWKQGVGARSFICYIYKPTWTDEDQAHMEEMKQDLGLFAKPVKSKMTGDEFPANPNSPWRIPMN